MSPNNRRLAPVALDTDLPKMIEFTEVGMGTRRHKKVKNIRAAPGKAANKYCV